MSSLNSLMTKAYAAQETVGRVVDNTPIALRISHPGTEAVTSVTVATAATLTLIDADGTTTIDITAAATDTLGEISDYINGLDNWSCKVLDGLRSDSVASSELADGAITSSTVNGETVWDALVDTSVAVALTYRCTFDRNVDINRPKGGHRVSLKGFDYYANVGTGAADMVQIYEWDAKNREETQIWQALSVDATDTEVTFASGNGAITAGWGNDLIVRITDAATLTDADGNHLQCAYTKE